jgi:hypothetical protein
MTSITFFVSARDIVCDSVYVYEGEDIIDIQKGCFCVHNNCDLHSYIIFC